MSDRQCASEVLYEAALEQAVQNPQEADWTRLYRLGVMSALQRVPRRSLPQDVAALGIMVMALESVGWALSVVSSRQVQVYFMGEGVDCLFSWLNGCRG
ncbi:MAG: hypothetical protein AAB375_03795 [Patescibacteria group bacterium]